MAKCTYSNTQFRGAFVVSKNKYRCIDYNPLSGAHFRQFNADLALIVDRWPLSNAPQWQVRYLVVHYLSGKKKGKIIRGPPQGS